MATCDYTSEEFADALHPTATPGQISLIHVRNRRWAYSPVDSRQFAWAATQARTTCGLAFTPCSFYGMPLLLNTAAVRACAVSYSIDRSDRSALQRRNDLADACLHNSGIPRPSAEVTGGSQRYLIWIFDEPLRSNELYKYFNIGAGLEKALRPLGATLIPIGSHGRIPMIESRDPLTERLCNLDPGSWRGPVDISHLLACSTQNVSGAVTESTERVWNMLLALNTLFHSRMGLFGIEAGSLDAWLSAFAAPLTLLSRSNLAAELSAVAHTIMNCSSKRALTARDRERITQIVQAATENSVSVGGTTHSIKAMKWRESLSRVLEITPDEMTGLPIRAICAKHDRQLLAEIRKPPTAPSFTIGPHVPENLSALLARSRHNASIVQLRPR